MNEGRSGIKGSQKARDLESNGFIFRRVSTDSIGTRYRLKIYVNMVE